MHRTVWVVFKTLLISFSLMVIMDVSLMVIDYKTALVRIGAIGEDMRYELAKNNCIPDDLAVMFDTRLKEIQKKSKVIHPNGGIEWNINDSITDTDGTVYQPVSEENIKEYGEGLSIAIKVIWQPHSFVFSRTKGEEGFAQRTEVGKMTTVQIFEYPTYAGRYLK